MNIGQIGLLVLVIAIIALLYFIGSSVSLWIQALVSGARVGLLNIIFMRFRKVPPKMIVEAKIMAVKAGIEITTDNLESHFLAGGNVLRVVQSLIAADKANIELDFNRAAAIDLAGRDVLEAVQMSVNPKVIETPLVAAMAKDGIQLKAISRITVRANIDRLVGGAGEETILARVGEGIVTTITPFPKPCWPKGWMQAPPMKFSPLILPMLMSARISAPSWKPTGPRRTRRSPRPRLKNDGLWPLQSNRR
jgi:uncharacterized protein YqfA (UPF0365 family)